jgi:hypothetical protein
MLSWWKRESIIAVPDEICGRFTKSSAKFGFSSSSNSSTSGMCCLFMAVQNTKSWFKTTAVDTFYNISAGNCRCGKNTHDLSSDSSSKWVTTSKMQQHWETWAMMILQKPMLQKTAKE